jgi:hypothetical protein
MKLHFQLALAGVALASCGQQRGAHQSPQNESAPPVQSPTVPVAAGRTDRPPGQTAAKPSAAAIDPKSTEAAVQLVRRFAELLNQRKFDEAYMLLGPNAPPRNEFDGSWEQFDSFSVRVGTAGEQEGAAGSIYLSVPLNVSAVGHGEGIRLSRTAILRRVNDVPGSTEAQRHWHIERIDRGDNR